MYLNKVEMAFCIDQVHTEVVLLIAIVFKAPAPLERCHSLVALRSLVSKLISLLVNLGPCSFRNSKLQEDIFHPVKLVKILVHIVNRLGGMASVLRHHIEVNQCPDTVQTTFERNYLPAVALAKVLPQEHPKDTARGFSSPFLAIASPRDRPSWA